MFTLTTRTSQLGLGDGLVEEEVFFLYQVTFEESGLEEESVLTLFPSITPTYWKGGREGGVGRVESGVDPDGVVTETRRLGKVRDFKGDENVTLPYDSGSLLHPAGPPRRATAYKKTIVFKTVLIQNM